MGPERCLPGAPGGPRGPGPQGGPPGEDMGTGRGLTRGLATGACPDPEGGQTRNAALLEREGHLSAAVPRKTGLCCPGSLDAHPLAQACLPAEPAEQQHRAGPAVTLAAGPIRAFSPPPPRVGGSSAREGTPLRARVRFDSWKESPRPGVLAAGSSALGETDLPGGCAPRV